MEIMVSRSSITTTGNNTGAWRFVRPVYERHTAPCSAACPAGEDIPRIEALVSEKKFKEAGEVILMENPFPSVCGRVCFHPCETACNRAGFDDAVAVNSLERFVGDLLDTSDGSLPFEAKEKNGKRIAIIGAGPGGLSAAYFLSRLGYSCEVFESEEKPGGLLRWGIPAYRLPEQVLDREIKRIESLGVKINCSTRLDSSFIETANESFDGVFVGTGLGSPIMMNIPGEELGIGWEVFLKEVKKGTQKEFKGKAVVIGGGNAAVDVARTLVRLGASVTIAYRRRIEDMPAFGSEIEIAISEGVEILELVAPVAIVQNAEQLSIELQSMKVEGQDGQRAKVVNDGDKKKSIVADRVYSAIGADVEDEWKGAKTVSRPGNRSALYNEKIPVIYGGDLVNADKSVTSAIGSGKEAAIMFDILLAEGGSKAGDEEAVKKTTAACQVGDGQSLSFEAYIGGERRNVVEGVVKFEDINLNYFEKTALKDKNSMKADLNGFDEVESGIDEVSAIYEAVRCFNCGICTDCGICSLFCPELSVLTGNEGRRIELEYCKGCGICVCECPRAAMSLVKEAE